MALDNNQSVVLLFILDLSAALDKKSLLCATSDATQMICSGYSASSVKNHPLLNHLVFLSVQVENGPEVTLLFKKDELYEKNYRPVTVLPILNNIYESLVSDQLSVYFKDILSGFISAYRKNYSCERTLLRPKEEWRASLDNKELVAVISLDLSKAFDCVPHELLVANLKECGVAENGVALLRNCLSGRSQRIKLGNKFSSWKPVRWKMRSAENAGCGKCGVWKMRSVENAKCGKCAVWKMRSVENAECGKCVENFNFPFQFPIPMRKNSVQTIKKK